MPLKIMKNVAPRSSDAESTQHGAWDKGRSFYVGDFLVKPLAGLIESSVGFQHLEPKTLKVLICLARNYGRTVTKQKLFEKVWPNTAVTDHVLTRCICQLRKALVDDGRKQEVIKTVYKCGYRLLIPVLPGPETEPLKAVEVFPNPKRYSEFISEGIGYREILSASNDHIYIYDRHCRYLFANPAGAGALGLKPQDMIGRHWRELGLEPEILTSFEARVMECFEKGISFVEQITYPTVFGDRTYEYSLSPVRDGQGDIGCVLVIVRAITPR